MLLDSREAVKRACEAYLAAMVGLVDELCRDDSAMAFLEPVNWKALGLMDYPSIVKTPMDLGTVRKRIKNGTYGSTAASAEQIAEDVRLVWTNCMLYNDDSSDLHHVAKRFLQRFENMYNAIKRDRPLDPSRDPSEEERARLMLMLHELDVSALGRAVAEIREHAPDALSAGANGAAEIAMDDLPRDLFQRLYYFCASESPDARLEAEKLRHERQQLEEQASRHRRIEERALELLDAVRKRAPGVVKATARVKKRKDGGRDGAAAKRRR